MLLKKLLYYSQFTKFENNIKQTWNVIKEVIGKKNNTHNQLTEMMIIENKEVFLSKHNSK